MKSIRIHFLFLSLMLMFCWNSVYAQDIVTYTADTDIKCTIDFQSIDVYVINDNPYVSVNDLSHYGFDISEDEDKIEIQRNKDKCADIVDRYKRDYSKNEHYEAYSLFYYNNYGGMPVYENKKKVFAGTEEVAGFIVENIVVVQVDALVAFGTVTWNENKRTVEVLIACHEVMENYNKNQTDMITEKPNENSDIIFKVFIKDGKYNGYGSLSYFMGRTFYGCFTDGLLNGIVYSTVVNRRSYQADATAVNIFKDGKANGPGYYALGYNNRAPYEGQTLYEAGEYCEGKLKNGVRICFDLPTQNAITYSVDEYAETLLYSPHQPPAYYESDLTVYLYGEAIDFGIHPFIENNRALVPLRSLLEKMGAKVSWDESSQQATIQNGNAVIICKIDSWLVTVNHMKRYIDVPVRLINNRTMIPLRFLSETLGYSIDYDEGQKQINIK